MPLVKSTLESGLKTLLTDMRTKTEISDDEFANRLATLIDSYIRSATVTTSVTGTCTTPAGAGTILGSGQGTLS